jgi:hypothetical protein
MEVEDLVSSRTTQSLKLSSDLFPLDICCKNVIQSPLIAYLLRKEFKKKSISLPQKMPTMEQTQTAIYNL